MLWRSFLTSLRIAIHTLMGHAFEKCDNPWLLNSMDKMHTQSAATAAELRQLLEEVTVLQQLVKRLVTQLFRIQHILQHGKCRVVKTRSTIGYI